MPTHEVTDKMRVEPNHVYVIPPSKAMVLRDGKLHTSPRATALDPQRLIDQFFRSLSEASAGRCAGVILSGTGTDGTRGLELIKAGGGLTFAQDGTAGHGGMPLSGIAAGCVDFTLPPESIAAELIRLRSHPLVAPAGKRMTNGPFDFF